MTGLAAPLALLLGASCSAPMCNLDTLAPYFAKLEAVREARGAPPVHILQIGDSHTAGDALTGSWRALLQERWGSGGRGVLAPGRPYDGYRARGVSVSMSPGWRVSASFGKGSSEPRPRLGLSSYSLTSTAAGASMTLTASPAMAFDRFVLCAIAGPDSGGVTVRVGAGEPQRLDFAADVEAPRCGTIRTAAPETVVEVTADAAPVTITSWASFRDDGGVALSNLGVVGSQLRHFARTDDAVLGEELRAYAPDLIILAFGTNEGFAQAIDVAGQEAALRAQVARLQGLAPGVPILLLGAPDALSNRSLLRGPGAADCGGGWFAPAGLAQERAMQRRVAVNLGLAYWDWQARMGGLCTARRWAEGDAPRMAPDHVHFRSAGGDVLARLLDDDLSRAAEAE